MTKGDRGTENINMRTLPSASKRKMNEQNRIPNGHRRAQRADDFSKYPSFFGIVLVSRGLLPAQHHH